MTSIISQSTTADEKKASRKSTSRSVSAKDKLNELQLRQQTMSYDPYLSGTSSNVRRLLGAPPSLSRDVITKSFVKLDCSHEASLGTECSGEESEAAKTADETEGELRPSQRDEEEENGTTGKRQQKRRKRRIRLTEIGPKAKKKAERREKLMAEKKNEVQEETNPTETHCQLSKMSPPLLEMENELGQNPPNKVKPSPHFFTPFQLLCDNLIRKFMAKDPENYFAQPVTELEAPGYHSIVDYPMSFSTIHDKIENNMYLNLDQFKSDICLVSDNAMLYNNTGSVYFLAAQKLKVLAKYYFSEKYLLFLVYSLPFGKALTEEQLGIRLRRKEEQTPRQLKEKSGRERLLPFLSDSQKTEEILNTAPVKIKDRLTGRRPCQIAYLDNREGAFALNVLTETATTKLTLGDHVKPLGKGNPGICAPFEPRICSDYLVSYTNPGPFASFAPHFDLTWATMSKRDSDLLLSCYGDRDNVTDATALRQMVSNSGTPTSDLVESMLNDLTDNEHSRTIALLGNTSVGEAPDKALHKTGKMIEDLASLQHNRLSKPIQPTLSEAIKPDESEIQLAEEIVQGLGRHVVQLGAKPVDLIQSPLLHQALGLDVDDYNVLSEFLEV
ncbi:hypothetical protein niasHS_017452 [Heterodera schachtii]|uniref:Bromo domain-containing protein n=1 Tax=Heterodera schachtii TaxID=97005 RepID=A0ABD2I0N0_HETSC